MFFLDMYYAHTILRRDNSHIRQKETRRLRETKKTPHAEASHSIWVFPFV